jgi:hypothetical protein
MNDNGWPLGVSRLFTKQHGGMNNKLKPVIYFACLAAYNDGHLHGLSRVAARRLVPPSKFCTKRELWRAHDTPALGTKGVVEAGFASQDLV